jgi:DNA gyrase subunit A
MAKKKGENEEVMEDSQFGSDADDKIEALLGIVPRNIVDEMKDSYLDYAMSVIASRALPDVRDGLKPVHRRILYSMHRNGLVPTASFTKSAKVVGDVIANYHPHGDSGSL